jgi:putative aldouronate transport system permease protein
MSQDAAGGAEPPARLERKLSTWTRLKRDYPLILMTVPAIVLLIVFAYIPMIGNIGAFTNYSPLKGTFGLGSEWVGLKNFAKIFATDSFYVALKNTLMITLFSILFYFPVPIFLAVLMNSILNSRIRTFVQSVVYLPHFFSWVLVITIFQQFIGGASPLSKWIIQNGGSPLTIMQNPDTFIALVTSQAIWKDAGWGMIIFLAALSTVDQSQYEAAVMDGANRWRRLWHVTLPALRPTIILLLILRLGDALNVGFEQMFLQRDAVGAGAAEVLDTYVYYQGIRYSDWGLALAAGLLKGVVALTLVLGANKVAHAFGEAGVYRKAS